MSDASSPRIAMIAAMGLNRVIGRDNKLPWHLPEDLKYFRSVTWGKPIVMGRKTFDSLGRPLPGRTNIVVSNRDGLQIPGASVQTSIDAALQQASRQAVLDGVEEVMVIGGETLYRQMLERADRLYLTLVEAEPEGDAWFPPFSAQDWELVTKREVSGTDEYPAHSYQVLDRLRG
ncbi:dihydrofolate reductase [Halopseudomonas sp.]|jgi:dihydrofolate reductase|uniref:dihydrofolate reductase n=1 Tax=Halopseudomonas sp. TaxID=2901191 RepID=UPI001A4A727D|nr:dihydrofolate reductase [Pseudomonas sp.]|tara:strand:- start:766 stop:1290 length:525 start_codon:yes stop_codon:yes gene_type:complete